MRSVAALTWPDALVALLQLLAERPRGAFRPIAGNAPTGTNDIIRALAIIAELRAALGTSGNAAGGSTTPDPMAHNAPLETVKVPDLFADIKPLPTLPLF